MSFTNINDPKIWSRKPRRGTNSNKASALAWVETISSGTHGACITDAMLETLMISSKARGIRGRSKQIILLYNEPPGCNGGGGYGGNPALAEAAVVEITGANRQRARINTVYIPEYSGQSYPNAVQFGQDLAASNNGRYEFHNPTN